jgi:hypothetical protein
MQDTTTTRFTPNDAFDVAFDEGDIIWGSDNVPVIVRRKRKIVAS